MCGIQIYANEKSKFRCRQMIVWTKNYPQRNKVFGYSRLLRARYAFFDHYTIKRVGFRFELSVKDGYQRIFRKWRNKHKGKRCFILGNGPSLNEMDISLLKNEITIGSNGIYKNFDKWGFTTDYLLFEDVVQTELRSNDIPKIKGPVKLAAIYNSYAFRKDETTFFMNVRLSDKFYWDNLAPCFSEDFSEIVYLGSTVTYLALQLAYHLGFDEVYLIGVDHDYGELPKLFPPGKITITEDNIHLVKGLHCDENYYKIGDMIGVPYVDYQNEAYEKARNVFEVHGRKVFNAGVGGKLEAFERKSFVDLF